MESLTNMGPDYQRRFHDVFPALAREHGVAFLPFLLEGVAGRADLNQRDGIHPTAEGARVIADHVWPVLEPMAAGGITMIELQRRLEDRDERHVAADDPPSARSPRVGRAGSWP